MNILTDELNPKTPGEYIDALIVANIRMWHAQEVVYEVETLEKMTRDEMYGFLKQGTWLNLLRNKMMDGLDREFVAGLPASDAPGSSKNPDAITMMRDTRPLWAQD